MAQEHNYYFREWRKGFCDFWMDRASTFMIYPSYSIKNNDAFASDDFHK